MATVKDVLTAARKYEAQGQFDKAKKFYQAVADRMPGTKYAGYANQQLAAIHKQMQQKVVDFDLDAMMKGDYQISGTKIDENDKLAKGISRFVSKVSTDSAKLAESVRSGVQHGLDDFQINQKHAAEKKELAETKVEKPQPKKKIVPPVFKKNQKVSKPKPQPQAVQIPPIPQTPPPAPPVQQTPPPIPTTANTYR